MYPTFSTEIYFDWRSYEFEEAITITVSSWIGMNERIYGKVKKAMLKKAVNSETAVSIATAVSHHLKEEKRLTFEGMIKKLEVTCQPNGNVYINGVLVPFIFPPQALSSRNREPSMSRRIAQATVLWHWRPK